MRSILYRRLERVEVEMTRKLTILAALLAMLLTASAPLVLAQQSEPEDDDLISSPPLDPDGDIAGREYTLFDGDVGIDCRYVPEDHPILQKCLDAGIVPLQILDGDDADTSVGGVQYASESTSLQR